MKLTLLLAALLLLAACTTGTPATEPPATDAPPTAVPPTATPVTTPTIPVESPPTESPPLPTAPPAETFPPFEGDVPVELMEQLFDETALLGDVGLGDVRVVRAEAVTWSDTTLGCAEEGEVGAQVLTDGYWVVLEVGGEEYDWRTSEDGPPRLCPQGQGEPPIEGLPD